MDDPFAAPSDLMTRRDEVITAGRYRLPNRDGSHKKGGWQRVTNLVSAITDSFGLRVWEMQQMMIAIHLDEATVMRDLALTMEAIRGADYPTRRGEVEGFLDRCKAISGGNEGSEFGNSRHALVEAQHLGTPMPATDAYGRRQLSLFTSALSRNGLERLPGWAERRVLIERFEAVGTLDAALRDGATGIVHIGDLKTQKKFWTWLEIAAQLACYANADAVWEDGRWVDMPPVSREVAMVLWMPKEHPSGEPAVDVYEVDIEAGWCTAQLAFQVTQDRRGGKSKENPRAWLRQAPPVTVTEQYAARFAAVDSLAEGSRLVAEARAAGVWCEVLADEARKSRDRLLRSTP